MKQIGGEQSVLFSLTAKELEALEEIVRAGRDLAPVAILPEGPTGGLVRFRSFEDAMLAKVAIA